MPDRPPLSFARGAPSLDIIDVEGLREAAQRAFANDPGGVTRYGTAVGYEPLRRWIAERHGVAENQVLAHPAGVAVIPTRAGQEDFNSFGATAALKGLQLLENVETMIAVELLCAASALEFQRPLHTSEPLEEAYVRIREVSAATDSDRSLTDDIAAVAKAIRSGLLADLLAAYLAA